VTGRPTAAWFTRLERARAAGDPPAERAVEAAARDEPPGALERVLAGLTTNGQPVPRGAHPAIAAFLDREGAMPTWARRERLLRAQAFAERHARAVLAVSSAVDFGASGGGSLVLDVFAVGGFDGDGRGLRTAQRLRLQRAAQRCARSPSSPGRIAEHDVLRAILGAPIELLDRVEARGVRVRAHEADDVVHLGSVTGALLGVDDALLPADAAEARAMRACLGREEEPAGRGR
jgi:hypothetical protein